MYLIQQDWDWAPGFSDKVVLVVLAHGPHLEWQGSKAPSFSEPVGPI